jgi:hypothetical protein
VSRWAGHARWVIDDSAADVEQADGTTLTLAI